MMKDKEILHRSLQFWINHIETGDIRTDKESLLKCSAGDYDMQRVISKMPKLEESQLVFISKLKDLQLKILNDKIKEVL